LRVMASSVFIMARIEFCNQDKVMRRDRSKGAYRFFGGMLYARYDSIGTRQVGRKKRGQRSVDEGRLRVDCLVLIFS